MSAPRETLSWGQVAGAAVGGFVLEWVVITFYVLATLDRARTSVLGDVLAFVGLPVLLALLLVPQRTRLGAAGVLIGLLIGSITGAGVCAGVGLLSG